MRGRVCNLLVQLLLGLARAVTLGSKSRRTRNYILLSHLRFPEPGGPSTRIYIPPGTDCPVIPLGHWVPFSSPLMTPSGGGILPASTRGRRRSFYYTIYRNSVCTSQESHYVILSRLHTGESEIFLLYHI
jgi:hypothetical protein